MPALAAIAPFALAACSTTTASTGAVTVGAGTVAGVGEMPGDIGLPVDRDAPPAEPLTEETTPVVTEPEPEPVVVDSDGIRPTDLGLAPFGDLVEGNRVIVIGDSIMASTAERYGGDMCNRLNEAGWDVEVDAEPWRFIDFAHRVLNRRLPPSDGADWDAAVVFFGSNFRGDYLDFEDQMRELVDRLAPRPVLVLTVSEFTETRTVVNDIIRSIAAGAPNVYLLDWADMTA
ncbi:MAG: SGNH/GDSL hydrolase family protein, partial [Ilumatobacteraceae bacterium]